MSSAIAQKVVLITGGNGGLGLATIRAFLASPNRYSVIFTSRSLDRALAAEKDLEPDIAASKGSQVVPKEMDIEDEKQVDKLFEEVKKDYGKVDVLINNAGISLDLAAMRGEVTPRQAWSQAYNINVTSTHFFTEKFIPLLLTSPSPRLIFITSIVGSLDHTTRPLGTTDVNASPPAGWPKKPMFQIPAYRASKAATNMMMRNWCRVLKEDKVVVHCLCPGQVASGLGGVPAEAKLARGAEHPKEAGEFVKKVAEGEMDEHQGKVIDRRGVIPW